MRDSLLCPVYQKWLQLHPEEARIECQQLKMKALDYRRKGQLKSARKLYAQVWEIARSILFSLRRPDNQSRLYHQDLVSFVAAAMAVNQCSDSQSELCNHVLHDTQQQLTALMPMYASEPRLLMIIQQLKDWLCNDNVIHTPSLANLH